MSPRRLLALSGLLLLGGCLYHAREQADDVVCTLAAQPFDVAPPAAESKPTAPAPTPAPAKKAETLPVPDMDVQTTAYMQATPNPASGKPRIELTIPAEIPGSETPPIALPREPAAKQRAIAQLYPELPPLPIEPGAQLGPDGQPYTLAVLQQLAATNSPQLRQAAADVEAARGNLIQARAYPNPTTGWNVQPSNDGSTAGLQGPFIEQTVKFAGKLKLASASADMDLRNAELALKRTRSDLATSVRNAYYALLVAKETVRVNKALAHFTDEVYRLQERLLEGGFPAPYEPAALRAQAYITRLAYKQSIQTYIYAWKQLVAAIGLRQLPLSQVAGRIDAVIPYYDYDAVLAYVLRNHTDVLTARNGIDKARYNLKLAQITPYPDVDFNISLLKEFAVAPKQMVHTVTVGFPLPVWDQNKGNIIASESALMRAGEEPHRVEESLTTNLATAYTGYKNNLDALEYYRKFILPDQVRFYRGVLERRQIDPNAAFADLVAAQQGLVADVTSYLTLLGSLWTSVVSVADLLQTDDLFQLGPPLPVPPLPDVETLFSWPCCHMCPAPGTGQKEACGCSSPPAAGAGQPKSSSENQTLPAPRPLEAPVQAAPVSGEPRHLPTADALPLDKAAQPAAPAEQPPTVAVPTALPDL
jgi:cobalt-zinc-cadmium efflux system outer membrane protein